MKQNKKQKKSHLKDTPEIVQQNMQELHTYRNIMIAVLILGKEGLRTGNTTGVINGMN